MTVILLRLAAVALLSLAGIGGETIGSAARKATPVTLVAAGDIAECAAPGVPAASAQATGAMIRNRLARTPRAFIIPLGDNAYDTGSAAEYTCFDAAWGFAKARMRPAPGNHEYGTPNAAGYFGYFGAVAGDPAKGYYSWDAGQWHIIALNSNDGSCAFVACGAGSAQLNWLRADLAAHESAVCTLAYWHHPRYSSGWHGRPDSPDGVNDPARNDPLAFIQPMWAMLARGGVDVVLNGHDHHYESFQPMNARGDLDPDGMRAFIVGTGGGDVGGIRGLVDWWTGHNSAVRQDGVWGVLTLRLSPGGYAWSYGTAAISPAYQAGEPRFTDSGTATCH